MHFIRGKPAEILQIPASVVTLGNFDGIHLGHQTLLNALLKQSAARQLPSVVIIFEPHPDEYFSKPNAVTARLTRLREKLAFFKAVGVDYVICLTFDSFLAKVTADDFVKNLLVNKLGSKHIVIGDDFHFGYQRQGNAAYLASVADGFGFSVTEMPSYQYHDMRVSSTRIRQALAVGDCALAEALLGRAYTMSGKVVHGEKLGRTLGYPTANIPVRREMSPISGIFAVMVHGIADQAMPGVASVGTRPTVGGKKTLLEVYLFDFDEDIYGRYLTVEFRAKFRDELYFANLDLLKEQMQKDEAWARQILS